jgi:hypothetical protein
VQDIEIKNRDYATYGTMIKQDIRNSTRYESKSMCEIRLGPDMFRGVVVDYSPEGVGVIMKNKSQIVSGELADVKILDYDMELKSKIVWIEEVGYHIRIGFRNLGSMNGKLKHYKLADVLIAISRSKKTGTLEIMTGSITKKIYIFNGNKIFAASTNTKDRLGEYLVKQGMITLEQLKEADALVSRKGQRLGKILLDLGYLKDSDLYKAVQNQVEGIIISLFNIEEGLFEFKEGSLPSEEPITLQISSANLIYKGIKQINNVTFVQKMCPPLYTILNASARPMEMFRTLTFEQTDKLILSHVNGINTIKMILSLSPAPRFETLKTIITFMSIGVIHIKEEHEEPAEIPHALFLNEPQEETTIPFINEGTEESYIAPEIARQKEDAAEEEKPEPVESESPVAEGFISPYATVNEELIVSNDTPDIDMPISPEEEAVSEELRADEETYMAPERVEPKEDAAVEEKPEPVESESPVAEEFISPYATDDEELIIRNDTQDADVPFPPEEEAVSEELRADEETYMAPERVEPKEDAAEEEKPEPVESESPVAEEFISPYAADNTSAPRKSGSRKKYALLLFIILIGAGMPFVYDNMSTFFPPSLKPTEAIVVAGKESTAVPALIRGVSYPSFHDMALAKAGPVISPPYPDFHKEALRKLLSE